VRTSLRGGAESTRGTMMVRAEADRSMLGSTPDHRAPHASYYTVLRRVPRRVQLARFSAGGATRNAAARSFTDAAYMST
jgi:hypothetical protein